MHNSVVLSEFRKIPWRKTRQFTPVFLPEKSHGLGSLAGYSPWVRQESDTTARLSTRARTHTHTHTHTSDSRTHPSSHKESLYLLAVTPNFPLPLVLWQPLICFLSLWIYLLWALHISGNRLPVAFFVWPLPLNFKVNPCCSMISAFY